MDVRILGAHNLPSRDIARNRITGCSSFLIDGVLALDAGSLASALSPEEQGQISAVLLTHRHFDHIRDIPSLALMTLDDPTTIDVYALSETLEGVHSHLMDGDVYPDFTRKITDAPPKYRFHSIKTNELLNVLDYEVKPISQPHPVPSVGFVVRTAGGVCIAFTGDTGGELLPFFEDEAAPEVLFVDVTYPSRMESLAKLTGHLTPALLREQLEAALKANLNLPRIVAIHIHVPHMEEVVREVKALAKEMGIDLVPGEEDMVVSA